MPKQIRITERAHKKLEKFDRENLLKRANAAYAVQRNNQEQLRESEEEIELWEATLSDGLEIE